MPDPLYFSLWFPSFEVDDMLPRVLSVMRQFTFSTEQPGITYLTVQPVSWNEPTILEQRFRPGVPPEQAILIASELLHEDHAYTFEGSWDLWGTLDGRSWTRQPSLVRFVVHGLEFDQGIYQEQGHILVDLGLDAAFLQEEVPLTEEAEEKVRENVQKLVDFTSALEKNSGASTRLLWSESEENLAQKLIARLQKVQ